MAESVYKTVLVVGSQRSGTTLACSILGRHSEINMLNESFTKDVLKLIGKQYRGNKLLAWRQIRYGQRGNRFSHIFNRLANIHMNSKRPQEVYRPFPNSAMSIEDYQKEGAVFIVVRRKKEEVISSMIKRSQLTPERAVKEWDWCDSVMTQLEKQGGHICDYHELVANPESEIRKMCKFLELEYEEEMLDGPKFNYFYPEKSSGFVPNEPS